MCQQNLETVTLSLTNYLHLKECEEMLHKPRKHTITIKQAKYYVPIYTLCTDEEEVKELGLDLKEAYEKLDKIEKENSDLKYTIRKYNSKMKLFLELIKF